MRSGGGYPPRNPSVESHAVTFARVTLTADDTGAVPPFPAASRPRAMDENGPGIEGDPSYSSSVVPPAAAIFSLAAPEKACAFT